MKKLLHFTQEQVTKILQAIAEEKRSVRKNEDGVEVLLKVCLCCISRAYNITWQSFLVLSLKAFDFPGRNMEWMPI